MKIINQLPLVRIKQYVHPVLIFTLLLVLSYQCSGHLIHAIDTTAALIDSGIWQLILLSLICFLGLITLSWWLVSICWKRLGLVPLNRMVSQFNTLKTWQQLGFYWASFALILLAGLICLVGIV